MRDAGLCSRKQLFVPPLRLLPQRAHPAPTVEMEDICEGVTPLPDFRGTEIDINHATLHALLSNKLLRAPPFFGQLALLSDGH